MEYYGEQMPLQQFLQASKTQGFIVLKDNDVVLEQYAGMADWEPHSIQSVSKTTIFSVIGALIVNGIIDPNAKVKILSAGDRLRLRRSHRAGAAGYECGQQF